MNFQAIVAAPFGALGIRCSDTHLQEICFLPPGTGSRHAGTELAARAVDQLAAWMNSPDHEFDLPLLDSGTAFQRRVWREISAIESGQVSTYGVIAERLHSAAQAVGQACGANPFPIVVPCHRVVARRALGGFAGHREGFLIRTKQWLLQHEAHHRSL